MFTNPTRRILNFEERNSLPYDQHLEDLYFLLKKYNIDFLLKNGLKDSLFVTVPAFENILKKRIADISCAFATPATMLEKIKSNPNRVLFFLPQGEKRAINQLKEHFPSRRIFSLVGDLLANILHGHPRFVYTDPPALVTPLRVSDDCFPIMLMGTRSSEVEYLADIYEQAGLGSARPYLNLTVATIKNLNSRFPLAHYVANIHERFAEKGAVTSLLSSDMLGFMLKSKMISERRFRDYIKKTGTRVVYYTMRDKIRQAVYDSYFDRRRFNSIWEMQKPVRENFKPSKLEMKDVFSRILSLVLEDMEAEEMIRKLPNILIITHEDLIMSPKEVLTNLSNFIGRPITKSVSANWLDSIKRYMPDLEKDSEAAMRHLVDRLGLHVNAAASLVPLQTLVSQIVHERMAQSE